MDYSKLIYKNASQARKETKISYIGGTSISSKIAKSEKKDIMTYVIYLAPHTLSGYNVCPMATHECINACLNKSGQNGELTKNNLINNMSRIDICRVNRTKLFFENRNYFMAWLLDEIFSAHKLATKKGFDFSIRINGTSDITPEIFIYKGYNILQLFPHIQFYDYTKVPNRTNLTTKYSNYHITFSYTGLNWDMANIALNNNVNVAVVFEQIPNMFKGIEVINGDMTDLRYLDKKGVIVGLKFKKIREKIDLQKSNFIVNPDNQDCKY